MDGEASYLNALRVLLRHGEDREDRTGTGTLSRFGHQFRFDLTESKVPLLTTKRVPWKMVLEELLWFLRGSTDSTALAEKGIRIWQGNTTRAFLDSRGLAHLPEGDIGAGYGFQWRHFGGRYVDCKAPYGPEVGVDQLAYVENMLKEDPRSRRICMTAWNPSSLHEMALPPCHVFAQFYVGNNRSLSCHLYQRSADMFLGFPWNMFSYACLTHVLAKRCDMRPGELVVSVGDMHVYKDHVRQVEEQLERSPAAAPKLRVSDAVRTKAWEELSVEDFEISNYDPLPAIKGKMSA
jgi:thymidylate synthase